MFIDKIINLAHSLNLKEVETNTLSPNAMAWGSLPFILLEVEERRMTQEFPFVWVLGLPFPLLDLLRTGALELVPSLSLTVYS